MSEGSNSGSALLSIIVAVSENGVIGRDNSLPWRLSRDLRRFKQLTVGHTLVMGRKTFDSIGKVLPDRHTVVITRNPAWSVPGVTVVHSIEEALRLGRQDSEIFIGGGVEVFRQTLGIADRLYLTRIHAAVDGDTFLPEVDWSRWREVFRERHQADEKNQYPFSFIDYERVT